ncbi:MAG: transposase [Bacteroidetes bacterium]|nr:transposase [Bacteroidota bacterium]
MGKFKNTFRIESARLKEWDYSNPWWYFVTINTKNHDCCFGEVVSDKVELNELGKIVRDEWLKTKDVRKNVDLDYYVIMPNHVHGIIIINGPEVETHRVRLGKEEAQISTRNVNANPDAFDASLRIVRNCLSDIIRGFKSAVTKKSAQISCAGFFWQSRFYDRIIRSEKELYNIRKYIEQNPPKWALEKEQPENIFDL